MPNLKFRLILWFLIACQLEFSVRANGPNTTCLNGIPNYCDVVTHTMCTSDSHYACIQCTEGYSLSTVTHQCSVSNPNWPYVNLQLIEPIEEHVVHINDLQNPCSTISVDSLGLAIVYDRLQSTLQIFNQSSGFNVVYQNIAIDESAPGLTCDAIFSVVFNPQESSLLFNVYGGNSIFIAYSAIFPQCGGSVSSLTGTVASGDIFMFSPWAEFATLTRYQIGLDLFTTGLPLSYILSDQFIVKVRSEFSPSLSNNPINSTNNNSQNLYCSTLSDLVLCNATTIDFSLCENSTGIPTPYFTLTPILDLDELTDGLNVSDVLRMINSSTPGTPFDEILFPLDGLGKLAQEAQTSTGASDTLIATILDAFIFKVWLFEDFSKQYSNLYTGAINNSANWNRYVLEHYYPLSTMISNLDLVRIKDLDSQIELVCENTLSDKLEEMPYLAMPSIQLYQIATSSSYYQTHAAIRDLSKPTLTFHTFDILSNSDYLLQWIPIGPILPHICYWGFDISIEDSTVYSMSLILTRSNTNSNSNPNIPIGTQITIPYMDSNFVLRPGTFLSILLYDFNFHATNNNEYGQFESSESASGAGRCDSTQITQDSIEIFDIGSNYSEIKFNVSDTGIYFILQVECDPSCFSCSGSSYEECTSCYPNHLFWKETNSCLPISYNTSAIIDNCLLWNSVTNECQQCNDGFELIPIQDLNTFVCNVSILSDATRFFIKFLGFIEDFVLEPNNAVSDSINLLDGSISDWKSISDELDYYYPYMMGFLTAQISDLIFKGFLQDQNSLIPGVTLTSEIATLTFKDSDLNTTYATTNALGFLDNPDDNVRRLLLQSSTAQTPVVSVTFPAGSTNTSLLLGYLIEVAGLLVNTWVSLPSSHYCPLSTGSGIEILAYDTSGNRLGKSVLINGTTINFKIPFGSKYKSNLRYQVVYWNDSSQTCETKYIVQQKVTSTGINVSASVIGVTFSLIEFQQDDSSSGAQDRVLWLLFLLFIIPLDLGLCYFLIRHYHKLVIQRMDRIESKEINGIGIIHPLFLLMYLSYELIIDVVTCQWSCCFKKCWCRQRCLKPHRRHSSDGTNLQQQQHEQLPMESEMNITALDETSKFSDTKTGLDQSRRKKNFANSKINPYTKQIKNQKTPITSTTLVSDENNQSVETRITSPVSNPDLKMAKISENPFLPSLSDQSNLQKKSVEATKNPRPQMRQEETKEPAKYSDQKIRSLISSPESFNPSSAINSNTNQTAKPLVYNSVQIAPNPKNNVVLTNGSFAPNPFLTEQENDQKRKLQQMKEKEELQQNQVETSLNVDGAEEYPEDEDEEAGSYDNNEMEYYNEDDIDAHFKA